MHAPRPGLAYHRLGTARFPWNVLEQLQAAMRRLARLLAL